MAGAAARGLDPRPRDGEAVALDAEAPHQLDVLVDPVVVVAGDRAGGPVDDAAGLGGEGVPHAGAAAVLGGGALDLVRGSARPETEASGQRREAIPGPGVRCTPGHPKTLTVDRPARVGDPHNLRMMRHDRPVSLAWQRAADRARTVESGRDTRHSFSFGAHYDPDNVGYGGLLVHNDDLLSPGAGYPEHGHADVEIVTWVVSGVLVHRDAHRRRRRPRPPARLQVQSAGAGIRHSEIADAASGPTRFVQAWVRPDVYDAAPAREVVAADPALAAGGLVPLASGGRRRARPRRRGRRRPCGWRGWRRARRSRCPTTRCSTCSSPAAPSRSPTASWATGDAVRVDGRARSPRRGHGGVRADGLDLQAMTLSAR